MPCIVTVNNIHISGKGIEPEIWIFALCSPSIFLEVLQGICYTDNVYEHLSSKKTNEIFYQIWEDVLDEE